MRLLLTEAWVNNMLDGLEEFLIGFIPFAILFIGGFVYLIIKLVNGKIKLRTIFIGVVTIYLGGMLSYFVSSWSPLLISPIILTMILGAISLKSFDKVQTKHAYTAFGIVGYFMLLFLFAIQAFF